MKLVSPNLPLNLPLCLSPLFSSPPPPLSSPPSLLSFSSLSPPFSLPSPLLPLSFLSPPSFLPLPSPPLVDPQVSLYLYSPYDYLCLAASIAVPAFLEAFTVQIDNLILSLFQFSLLLVSYT